MIWENGIFKIDDNKDSIDIERVWRLLRDSHWAKDRTKQTVRLSIEHALCFGLFAGEKQIGFARVLTDHATYAVLLDMIVHEDYRNRGLGRWLMDVITNHAAIRNIRQILWTSTAERFYRKFGFSRLDSSPSVLVKPPF